MTTLKRPSLQIDDPLAPSPADNSTEPHADAAPTSPEAIQSRPGDRDRGRSNRGRRGKTEGTSPPATVQKGLPTPRVADGAGDAVWRTWSAITGVGSFRLPHERLTELGDTARELQLPIGMIVTAAITQLLDQPPQVIAALVDRADDARIQGRRNARQRRTESTSE